MRNVHCLKSHHFRNLVAVRRQAIFKEARVSHLCYLVRVMRGQASKLLFRICAIWLLYCVVKEVGSLQCLQERCYGFHR